MGWFSDETKIEVFSSAYPLFKVPANPTADAVLYAILKGESISTTLLNMTLGNVNSNIDVMYKYAKENYTLGLPQGNGNTLTPPDNETIIAIIKEDLAISEGIILDYSIMESMTVELMLLPFLTTERNYDFILNTIGIFPISDGYPENMIINNASCKMSIYNLAFNEDNTKVIITYLAESKVPENADTEYENRPIYQLYKDTSNIKYFTPFYIEEEVDLPLNLRINDTYCIVKYFLLDALGEPIFDNNWWYYDITTNKYPELVPAINTDNNTFLPVIPLRYANSDLTTGSHTDTELYKTSKKLLKKLNVNIDTLAESINANDNIDDIDNAYVMFGVDLQKDDNPGLYYLTEFFDYLSDLDEVKRHVFINTILKDKEVPSNGFNINNPTQVNTAETFNTVTPKFITNIVGTNNSIDLSEYGLDLTILYNYIESVIINGSIGPIGTATKTINMPTNMVGTPYGISHFIDNTELVLKAQVSTRYYKKVTIKGLRQINRVYKGKPIVTNCVQVASNVDNHNLILPIHYSIAKRLPLRLKNDLYMQCTIVVFNSYVKTSVAWYQQDWFSVFVMAVAFAISVWSGQYWIAGLAKALEAGTAIMFLLTTAIVAVAVKTAFKFIVEGIGGELAMILAIVLTIATLTINPQGMISLPGLVGNMPTAQVLLTTSSALLEGAKTVFSGEIEDIKEEYEDFNSDVSIKTARLDKALELLDTRADFDPLNFTDLKSLKLKPYETPDMFFERTIHSGNVGVIVLDVIENYYDFMLKLPETQVYL